MGVVDFAGEKLFIIIYYMYNIADNFYYNNIVIYVLYNNFKFDMHIVNFMIRRLL